MINKEITELRKLSDNELLELRKETVKLLVGAHRGVSPLVPIDKRGKVRVKIARIDTLMGERKRRGFLEQIKI